VKLRALLRESWAATRSRLVPGLMVAALCAGMCAATLATVGRTAGTEADVLARLEQAGSRQLVVIDRVAGGWLTDTVVASVAALSCVERAVGLTPAADVRSGSLPGGGTPVPAWGVVGSIAAVADIVSGRQPGPGEAVASRAALRALGHDGPTGYVVQGDSEYPVVGVFEARQPFTDLADGILVSAPPGVRAVQLHVIAATAPAVGVTEQLTLAIIAARLPSDLAVQSATGLADLQAGIAGDLTVFSRQLLLLVLGSGALLTAVVVLADTLVRRADLGRRRALGASRAVIVALVVLRGLMAGLAGVVVGTAGALIALHQWGVAVPASFTAGTAVLALLVTVLASLGPALYAALRDPVSVLRVA
jgi:putative ABC transport system permease protein